MRLSPCISTIVVSESVIQHWSYSRILPVSAGKAQQAIRLSAELRLAEWIESLKVCVQVHTKASAVIWLFLIIKITAVGKK